MSKCVIPVSGGIDSTVMLYDAAASKTYSDIFAISFYYGQRHATNELACATKSVNTLKEKYPEINIYHRNIDLSFFGEIAISSSITNNDIAVAQTKDVLGDPQPVYYVPFRNLMMLSILCSFAEAHGARDVYYGSALVDSQAGYWDSSNEFYLNLASVIGLNRKNKISIITPLIKLDKKDIIKLGDERGVDFKSTWTCYEGKEQACGYCPACSSRIKGFMDYMMVDPIEYSRKIKFI
jgi:7-cyano-7-deazaguanine synthase